MFGQVVDPECEQCNLAFGTPGILFAFAKLAKNLFFLFGC
jgi:hypothetical protein